MFKHRLLLNFIIFHDYSGPIRAETRARSVKRQIDWHNVFGLSCDSTYQTIRRPVETWNHWFLSMWSSEGHWCFWHLYQSCRCFLDAFEMCMICFLSESGGLDRRQGACLHPSRSDDQNTMSQWHSSWTRHPPTLLEGFGASSCWFFCESENVQGTQYISPSWAHDETPWNPSLFLCQACLVTKVSIESHEAPADVRDNFTSEINNILTKIHGQSMRRSHSDIVNIVTGHSWDL